MKQERTLYGIYSVEAKQAQNISFNSIETQIYTAIDAGLPWLQIRDKTLQHKLWPLWLDIAIAAQQSGTQLIINDHTDLLAYVLKHLPSHSNHTLGLHLGQTDESLSKARDIFGTEITIGVTCHNSIQLAELAVSAGADYVAFGRFFPSKTKPKAPPASIKTLDEFRQQHPTPIAVIGGISLETTGDLLNSPANLYAVSNALWAQSCIADTVKKFIHVLNATD